jgi:twitching motility protein PilT
MARIDSILGIVVQQGANELRVGTDREPKMLAHGAVKRFSMPETNEETLRELLGEVLSPDREQALRERGRADLAYTTEAGTTFHVTLTSRPSGGFDALFLRASSRGAAGAQGGAPAGHAPAPQAPPRPAFATPATAPAAFAPAGLVPPSERGLRATSSSRLEVAPASVAAPTGAASWTWSVSLRDSELVQRALASRATDLHLVDDDAPVIRVDGRLLRLDEEPVVDVVGALGLDPTARATLERGESIELSVDVDVDKRARVHVYRASTGAAAAIRFFGRTPSSLAALNLPVPLDDLIDLPHGLVLVCGATGSGKSTTLAALAQEALRRRSVTLEDPIEYTLVAGDASLVRQRQVGRDVPDFATGLRDALREDPDVLVVGEMRDPETIALALTAAETGHLVIATLHSGSTASAIERIVDSSPNERQSQIRTQLADCLRVVIAQRLLPRARGGGRLPALEVLRVNHAAASLIRDAKTAQLASVLQSGRREGMISLERSLADRVNAGDVRPEHARAAANDVEALTTYLGK